ncbi:MAG: hypothetical protein JWQ19_3832 [Subtercola sp.]|nr:hypothetical protein [Subtercola sp.]
MLNQGDNSITTALEQLALALGESGAVPLPELVRALERAGERLRTRTDSVEQPTDLVSQADASRAIGVSRQAVNQWVRNGVLKSYAGGTGASRYGPSVSLSEVAIAANRRTREVPFSATRKRELIEFLTLLQSGPAARLAGQVASLVEAGAVERDVSEHALVLKEFVVASMGEGDEQQEFSPAGVRQLAQMTPPLHVDLDSAFGRLAHSLGLLIVATDGSAGFDSPSTALLGLLGVATVGSQYPGRDADGARGIAGAAQRVWAREWPTRLYEASFHVGELVPCPLVRFTASLTYLDHNRFLRQAQPSGVSIAYSRGPGPLLPERFFGAPILHDMMSGERSSGPVWSFSQRAAELGWPVGIPSTSSPFRLFNFELGLLQGSIHGIRRYSYSGADAGRELKRHADTLSASDRAFYLDQAVSILARTIADSQIELCAVDELDDFDWWKDHIIRSSPREILLGLRDESARKVAHALLVHTTLLPDVIEAAESDGPLRDRLRIYVKNLEFDVISARYSDDLKRGVTRMIKPGGQAIDESAAREMAETEISRLLARASS